MIGEISYDEMRKSADELSRSSQIIREIVEKYGDDLTKVLDFCNTLDSYSKFLETSVQLYQDSDSALQVMIEKNK